MIERLLAAFARSGRERRYRWRWLGYLLTTAALFYLAYVLIGSSTRLRQVDLSNYLMPVLAAIGIYLVSLIVQFVVWARMISFHRHVGWEDIKIYARTILMRRLPGGPWHWVGRISMYSSSTEVPARVSAAGSLVEWTLVLLVGAGLFFAVAEGLPALLRLSLLSAATGLALAIAIVWQPHTRSRATRLAEAILWIFLYAVAWQAGLVIFLAIANTAGAGLGWLEGMQVWMVAGGLGVITVVLPFTLGVLEASLVLLLQPYLDPLLALVVALMIRLIYVAGDALWGFLGWQFGRLIFLRKRSNTSTDEPLGA